MSESATAQTSSQDRSPSPTAARDRGTGSSATDEGGLSLQSSRGSTTIADSVVAKIASIATREINGVASLGGGASSAIGGVVGRIRGEEHSTSGVSVEVGEQQAAVDVTIRVEYPAPIQQVADAVRGNVIDRVESMTALEVVEVNVSVTDLAFPGDEDDGEDQQPPQRVQ